MLGLPAPNIRIVSYQKAEITTDIRMVSNSTYTLTLCEHPATTWYTGIVGRRFQLLTYRKNFLSFFNCGENKTPGYGESETPIDDDGKYVPLTDYKKIRKEVALLKRAIANNWSSKLHNHAFEGLTGCVPQPIDKNVFGGIVDLRKLCHKPT